MSIVGFTLELDGDVSSFTRSVRTQMQSAIAARAGVDPSAVELAVSPGSVIVDVSIQTTTATAVSVQSMMVSATSSPSSAIAMLASVTGVSIAVLAVVTPPFIVNVAPPPPPQPSPPPPMSPGTGASSVETSGSPSIVIAISIALGIALALTLVYVCRLRCRHRRAMTTTAARAARAEEAGGLREGRRRLEAPGSPRPHAPPAPTLRRPPTADPAISPVVAVPVAVGTPPPMMPSWEEALRQVLPENVRDEASRLVERLRQLVNGPVAPPSPRTANNKHEMAQGTEMSGSRPVASEPALGNSGGSTLRSFTSISSTSCPSTSRSSTSDSTPTLQLFEVVSTFDAISPKVKQLMDKMVEMGFGDFSRHKACEYLEANGHDVEAALDAILRSYSC